MRRIGLIALAVLWMLAGAASAQGALCPGPITQLTSADTDQIEPVISGNRVVWTFDALANGYDLYALDLTGGPAVDITPFAGNQYFNSIDGHYAVFIDDRNPQVVTVGLYDLNQHAATPMNIDNVSASRPAVSNPGGGDSVDVVYVHADADRDIVLVRDFLDVRFITQGPDQEDAPRIHGDYIVWQSLPFGEKLHHIYAYRISTMQTTQLTADHDDTNSDTDGVTVVFTRNGNAIMAMPVSGGLLRQLSTPNTPNVRDRAAVSGDTVVWDDYRNGNDWDVYYASIASGQDQLLAGGPDDQFLADVDGANVVYTGGPAGGIHNIYLRQLVPCSTPPDTVPPVTTALPVPLAPNGSNGWDITDVTVALTASDNPGGSGVKEIHYWLSGAQTGSAVIPDATASVTISAEGNTTLSYFAADNAGNQGAVQTLTVQIDKTPPSLTLPAANETADATSPAGATVTYTVSATDNLTTNPTVACAPASGSTFPIGTTTVVCTATDAAGNSASGSFQVLVQGAAAQVSNLIGIVQSFNLLEGITDSLDAKLANIKSALTAGKPGNATSSCNQLTAFSNEAQAGKALTTDEASQLVSSANRTKAVIGCPSRASSWSSAQPQ
jgi:beta propeller repeat protein